MGQTFFDTFISAYERVGPEERLLDGDTILIPPAEDYGYTSTPQNALTFAAMGVDGIHNGILKIGGEVRDDSPIVQVSPMDSEDVFIIGASLLTYLSEGSSVTEEAMREIFSAERRGEAQLVRFLSEHFTSGDYMLEESRLLTLKEQFGHCIERKPDRAKAG